MVIDHVVTLQSKIAAAAKQASLEAVQNTAAFKPEAEPELPRTRVMLALSAEAPSGRFRIRLWDEYGRNPTDPADHKLNKKKKDNLRFSGRMTPTDLVLVPHENFDGGTLTWVVRLQASAAAQSYMVRLTVLQIDGDERTSTGDFVYSGPLDDVEEVTGRFHFKVEP